VFLKTIMKIVVIFLLVALAIVGTLWDFSLLPTSLDEGLFRYRLSEKTIHGAQVINLSELMGGDWEVVCESHGYNGPLYLKKYGRTYPPAAPPQDGIWGLVFIAKDGSPRYVVGSLKHGGANINITSGCIERSNAVLIRSGPSPSPTYSLLRYR